MGRLPTGPKTYHISASHGPDTDMMKFYSTNYSTKFGKEGFEPRLGKHVGTGYKSNFRPGVYYSARLDEKDNPAMGQIIQGNYSSITQLHFKPSRDSNGNDRLPCNLTQVGSGFVRQKPITYPTVGEVRGVYVDTKQHGIGPKYQPYLHKLQSKDPVALEHKGHGPGYMSTESSVRFKGTPSQRLDTSTKTVGRKEGSGYTHAYNVEPITFHPGSPFKNEMPGFLTDRPTGVSVMKTSYRQSRYSHGAERLPVISNRSEHETGFTHEKAKPLYVHRVMEHAYTKKSDMPKYVTDRIRKIDPAEYLNLTNPDNHSSIAAKSFQGQQQPTPSENERLGHFVMGNKELSGYADNNDKPKVQLPVEPYRWITHYDTKFYDMNPKGKARAGRTFGAVMDQLPNGFTKSTAVHSYGPALDTTEQLRNLEPYVARSIKATDRFYDDHTHDMKLHQKMAAVF